MWRKDYEKKFIPIRTLDGHNNSIVSLIYINDFNYLCSGSDDKTIRIWDYNQNFICIKIIDDLNSEIDNLKYARNRLIACCENGIIFFINVSSLKKVRSVQFTKDAI
jgi:WD40 repeat protein